MTVPAPAAASPSALAAWIGTWSRPPDRPAQVALGLAAALLALALVPGGPRWLAASLDFASLADFARKRRFLTIAAFVAAFLSLGYVAFYLRGGPRAEDAATYWVQGRALSHGQLAWAAPDPSASFRARDLIFGAPDHIAGIFPPGFALLLAPAFLVGAPMLVGPLLAAALVVATWLLAREAARAAGEDDDGAEALARIAAALSVLSAALRYHTADVLPYGATAVAVAMALACALRARRTDEARLFGVAGLAVGFAVATHPVSAVTTGAVVAVLAFGARRRGKALAWGLGAALPGVLLLLASNHAAVGQALGSPGRAYASLLGAASGVDAGTRALTMLHRVRAHLLDVANFEPLALLALVPFVRRTPGRSSASVLLGLVILGQLALVAPLDHAAVEPGSGARSLVAIVPLEHVLVGLALARLFPRHLAQAAMATFALSLAGFAVHGAYDHEALAKAGLGRPSYEPDVAREANVAHGLLFFEDDDGFELAYDPGVPASHGIQGARWRGDDHDRLLYDSLGHPQIHKYTVTPDGASIAFWVPPAVGSDTWRFEAEADWPPIASSGGIVTVVEAVGASDGRALSLEPVGGGEATLTISLPAPRGPLPADKKAWSVVPRVFQRGSKGEGDMVAKATLDGPPVATWTWTDGAATPGVVELNALPVELGGDVPRAWLVIRARGGAVALDKTTVRPK